MILLKNFDSVNRSWQKDESRWKTLDGVFFTSSYCLSMQIFTKYTIIKLESLFNRKKLIWDLSTFLYTYLLELFEKYIYTHNLVCK